MEKTLKLSCLICEADFYTVSNENKSVTCGYSCGRKLAWQKRTRAAIKVCAYCKESFTGQNGKYCSNTCNGKGQSISHTCIQCNKVFVGRATQKMCSKICRTNNTKKQDALWKSPDYIKEYHRIYRHENRVKILSYQTERRDMKKKGSLTVKEWRGILKYYDNKCLKCGSSENITIDHVIPLSKGGKHEAGNIQPLCKKCNSSKSTKEIDYRLKKKLVEAQFTIIIKEV